MQSQHSSPVERERRTVPHALGEVVQRGQALILNRLDLLGVELRQALDASITRVFKLGVALLLFFSGFVCLTVAAILAIGQTFDFAMASTIVGVTYLIVGGTLVAGARHRQRVRMGALARDPTETT